MGSKERRLSYSIAFKIEVMNTLENMEIVQQKRRFGSPPTENVI